MTSLDATGVVREVIVPPGEGRAVEVAAGQYLSVIDVEGMQVADFVAFCRHDLREYLSTSHTRSMLGRIVLRVGDRLSTNFRRHLFEVVHDDVGAHDLLFAACDPMRYEQDFGVRGHRNCRDNLLAALQPYGVEAWWLPDPVNFFMNTPTDADGVFQMHPAQSRPGDRVELRCLMDAVVAVSSCPQDLTPISGGKITPLKLVVTKGPSGG